MNIYCPDKNEYEAIVDLWEASVRASHNFLPEEDIQYYKPLILNDYLTAVELRCAKDKKGNILGFIGVAERKIEMLFVAPEHFGKGVGKFLLQNAVNELGATKVDVNEQNPEALVFYQYMGFKITGRSSVDSQGKPYPLLHMELDKK